MVHLSRRLFKCFFITQLILISILRISLTIRSTLSADSNHFQPKKWYPPIFASVAVSGITSLAWQSIVLCKPSAALRAVFWLTPFLTWSVAILFVVIGLTTCATITEILLIFGISQATYSYWVSDRLNYAEKILSASTASPPAKTHTTVCLSVITSMFYCSFLVIGIGGATSTGKNLEILFTSMIMISMTWTMQVYKNVQVVAISSVKYKKIVSGEDMDAFSAFLFTIRHLLGSVCIGSILAPIISLIRGSSRGITVLLGGRDNVMFSFVNCYSNIANTLITYGNRWGFVYVGAYDKGFVEASHDTWAMFRRSEEFEQLIDSDITSSFCFLSGIAIGSMSALTGGTWALLIHKDYSIEVSIYAFIIGYFVCRVALGWLQACVLAQYVAYAENPESSQFSCTIQHRIEQLRRHNVQQS